MSAEMYFARACVRDPEWRRAAVRYARYILNASRAFPFHVPPAVAAFVDADRVEHALGDWLASRAREIYRQRFGFDQDFMRLLRAGQWPYMGRLAKGEYPRGVNRENAAVQTVVADALVRFAAGDIEDFEPAMNAAYDAVIAKRAAERQADPFEISRWLDDGGAFLP